MSPLLFLAIPLVIFALGSGVLYLGSRYRGSTIRMRRAPADLQTMAPMLREQRDAGWRPGTGSYTRR